MKFLSWTIGPINFRSGFILLAFACAVTGLACSSDSPYRKGTPTAEIGSGIFYLDREIPSGGGQHNTAGWLERPDRANTELPDRLVAALELTPASVVADIGAGTGYLTFRISPVVPHGRVYAVDIDEELLGSIESKISADSITNVIPVLGSLNDPGLTAEIDVALIAISYHEFSQPFEMMTAIFEDLRPGGTLVLVEYRGEDETIPVNKLHRLTVDQARKELEYVGFIFRNVIDILPQQHILIFEKPAAPTT